MWKDDNTHHCKLTLMHGQPTYQILVKTTGWCMVEQRCISMLILDVSSANKYDIMLLTQSRALGSGSRLQVVDDGPCRQTDVGEALTR